MKRLFIFIVAVSALMMGTQTAEAQSWKDILKKAGAAVADAATDGKYSEKALVGEWTYLEPALKMEGEDVLSGFAAVALEQSATKHLAKVYDKIGLRPGKGTLAFLKDNKYEARAEKRMITGGYAYNGETHEITFSFDKKYSKGKVDPVMGRVYVKGDEMSIVFPVTKLIELVKTIGDKVPQLQGVAKLMENYKGVYLGVKFSRVGAAK